MSSGRRLRVWEGRAESDWRVRWQTPHVRFYSRIRSTNLLALRLAARGAPHGTCIIADHQTAGRGRRGRAWHDTPGKSLLLSIVLRDRTDAGAAGALPIRIGLLAAAAIHDVTGLHVEVKWPNDLLTPAGEKLGGVLCEGSVGARSDGYIAAGIGINVARQRNDLAVGLAPGATTLGDALGCTPGRGPLADAIVPRLVSLAHPFAPLSSDERTEAARRSAELGRNVEIDGTPIGIAIGLDADGALRVRSEHGVSVVRHGTLRLAGTVDDCHAAHAAP